MFRGKGGSFISQALYKDKSMPVEDRVKAQTKTVIFDMPVSLLGFYDENMDFVVEPGKVDVFIGSSSEDIRAKGQFELVGNKVIVGGNERKFTTKVTVVE